MLPHQPAKQRHAGLAPGRRTARSLLDTLATMSSGAAFQPAADLPAPATAAELEIGQRIALGSLTFDAAGIKAFARAFDPQDFHLDEAAAAAHLFGGLTASGFHSLAALFGLQVRAGVFARCNLGGRGMDDVRWLRPVRPGLVYEGAVSILAIRPVPEKRRADVAVRYVLEEASGPPVLQATIHHLMRHG